MLLVVTVGILRLALAFARDDNETDGIVYFLLALPSMTVIHFVPPSVDISNMKL